MAEIHNPDLAKQILSTLSANPEESLGSLITEFISYVEQHKGNGELSGLAAKVDPALIEHARILVNSGDSLSALKLFIVESNLPIPRSSDSAARQLSKEIRVALSDSEDAKLEKRPPSPTLRLGTSAHRMIESLETCGGDFSLLSKDKIELISNGTEIVGFVIKNTAPNLQLDFNSIPDLPTSVLGKTGSELVGGEVLEQDEFVRFEVPLPQKPDETPAKEWILDLIRSNLEEIKRNSGSLPSKPYDIYEVLSNVETCAPLIKIIEVGHILYGNHSAMSLISEGNGNDNDYFIGRETIQEFPSLNWLAILRRTLEVAEETREGSKKDPALVELRLGNLNILNGTEIKGGIMDMLSVSLDYIYPSLSETGLSMPFESFVKLVENRFNTQSKRYHRKVTENGVPTKGESQTRLQKNFRSFATEMQKVIGSEAFQTMRFTIWDFKFPAGDGGWFTSFYEGGLPELKDVEQVTDYIFSAVAQLCWAERWASNEGEDFKLTLQDVIEFAERTGIHDRINACIKYQMPEKEIRYEVACSSPTQLEEWGKSFLDRRTKVSKSREKMNILRTLHMLAMPRLMGVESVVRAHVPIPELISGFCKEKHGRNHLLLNEFGTFLKDMNKNSGFFVKNAVFFEEEGIYVFWIENSKILDQSFRIAINSKGQFTITGLDEGRISGSLSTDVSWMSVNLKPDLLNDHLAQNIWGKLNEWKIDSSSVKGQMVGTEIIYPNGESKSVAHGKPIICKQDLMTGEWSLDGKSVEEFFKNNLGRDPYRITQLAALLKDKPVRGTDVFCPLPGHKNINDEAAHWYVDGNRHYIHCFRCHTTIEISGNKFNPNIKPLSVGYGPEDYVPVSESRHQDFDSIITLGSILSKKFEDARRYLIEERGLDPDHDLGQWGYVPPEIAQELANLVDEKTGILSSLKGKQSRKERIDFLKDTSLIPPESRASIHRILDLLEGLNDSEKLRLMKLITINSLKNWRGRAIIGRWKEKGKEEELEHLGGKVLFPTLWFHEDDETLELKTANFMGRGIEFNGTPLYQGRKQHKAPLKTTLRETDSTRLRATPTGIWLKDKDAFLDAVLLNRTDSVVVFEGILNTATFNRFRPDLQNNCITVLGTGYRELIAMLRFLGVDGDPVKSPWTRSGKIKTIYLASDFDEGGMEAFERNSKELRKEFPGIEVKHARELMPDDVRAVLPPAELALYQRTIDYPGGRKVVKTGKYYEFKLDLNDLIANHGKDWAKKNKIPLLHQMAIKKIRQRYSYKQ